VTSYAVSLRDVYKSYHLFNSPLARLKEALHPFGRHYHREFMALKNISFDVPKGQTLGVLGRNGSGKSTLLQVIAGILHATLGSVEVNGRISALLELGAGFNPEFTGEDNVMLYGAIHGLSSAQMRDRMPEIAAFADIGDFFYQPVKLYSSGMFVRVAFSAAIHLDPDILIIDEALSVGDLKFQNKCFQKLKQFQKAGHTIILVTHSTTLITSLCERALLVEDGELVFDGHPVGAVDRYFKLLFAPQDACSARLLQDEWRSASDILSALAISDSADHCHTRPGYNRQEVRLQGRGAQIIDYVITSPAGTDSEQIPSNCSVAIYIKTKFERSIAEPIVGFAIKTVEGIEICGTNTFMMQQAVPAVGAGEICLFKFTLEQRLVPGDYFIDLGITECNGTKGGAVLDVRRSIAHITITETTPACCNGLVDLAPRFEVVSRDSHVVRSH